MLYGTRLAGRIEAVADQKEKLLKVRNLWFEPGVRQTRKMDQAIGAAVRRLARFNELPCAPFDPERGTVK